MNKTIIAALLLCLLLLSGCILNPWRHTNRIKITTATDTFIFNNCTTIPGEHYDLNIENNLIDSNNNVVCYREDYIKG